MREEDHLPPDDYRPSWALHLQPGGALLLDRRSQYFLRLSAEAAEIVLGLTTTGGDLDRVAVLRTRSMKEPVSGAAVERLLRAHPITESWLHGALQGPLRVTGSVSAYVPVTCTLQLTNACNLRCSFCYAGSGPKGPAELSADQWLRVIFDLAGAGVSGVTFTGGEPTLVRDFPRLLAAAGSSLATVDVFSNGMRWSDHLLRLAQALGNVRCQVSIDGGRDHHDALRGVRGSYDRALESIRRMREHDLPVVVAMTVSPANHRDVGRLVEEVAGLGASVFRAGLVQSVGRGANDAFALDRNQKESVRQQLDAFRDDPRIVVPDWGPCEDDSAARIAQVLGTEAERLTPGYLHWYVMADGVVTPCQIEGQALGHILQDPLHVIGSEERLDRCRSEATQCHCIRRVQPPDVRMPAFAAQAG